MEEKLEDRTEIRNLKAAFGMRIMHNFMDVMGLATLVAFTFVIILIALPSQGALIYYYVPNKVNLEFRSVSGYLCRYDRY